MTSELSREDDSAGSPPDVPVSTEYIEGHKSTTPRRTTLSAGYMDTPGRADL